MKLVQGYNENRNQGLDYKGKTTFMSNYDFIPSYKVSQTKRKFLVKRN